MLTEVMTWFISFYMKIATLCSQLSLMEPQFTCTADFTFETYHQETKLVQTLMAIKPEFEHVKNMLLQ